MVSHISEKDLTIYIQPIFNTKTFKIECSEVLVRHKKGVSVADIINYYEKMNKTLELDKFILKESCKLLNKHSDIFDKLSINLSKHTLENKGIYKELHDIIKRSNIDISRIIFEINEDTTLHNNNVLYNINGLKQNGHKLAIDDIGSGKCAIEHAYMLSVDMVKFDGVILQLAMNKVIEFVRSHIYDLNSLGICTVIEKVESVEELNAAKQSGFSMIQGYIFSKPIPVSEYLDKYSTNKIYTFKDAI